MTQPDKATARDLTPREKASARAAALLARMVPRDQYMPPAGLTKEQGLAVYDMFVELLRREIENPFPTSITIDQTGRVIAYGYGERHGIAP